MPGEFLSAGNGCKQAECEWVAQLRNATEQPN